MTKLNFSLALRHLWKNKLFSIINILGLSLGLVSCAIILLHVKFELGYDKIHVNKNRIARVITNNFAFTPYAMASHGSHHVVRVFHASAKQGSGTLGCGSLQYSGNS